MTLPNVSKLIQAQRDFFASGKTKDIEFRLEQIRRLREVLLKNEAEIYRALHQDLHKPDFEAYVGELGFVLEETKQFLKRLKKWNAPRKASVPISLWPGSARLYPEPHGIVLVLSPWNYPLQLSLSPALGAMGAGNCVLLKPSELAPATSTLMRRLVSENYPENYFAVLEGGVDITQNLLKEKFDYIFFTGSTRVGQIVMRAAAEHLTPLTLELGGKSPCIVDETADLKVGARRIAWGKFFNTGQTCVAPDYLLVQRKVYGELLENLKHEVREFYGENPKNSPDYGRIVNRHHFERLSKLLSHGKIAFGGETDPKDLYIAPTLLTDVAVDSPVMQEEVFGPILPIIPVDDVEQAVDFVRQRPRPLALYVFSTDRERAAKIMDKLSFGGGCINDAITHLAVSDLPFGGVGDSGFGAYHGKFSFDTFTHWKGIFRKPNFLDLKVKYPPYAGRLGLAKKLIG